MDQMTLGAILLVLLLGAVLVAVVRAAPERIIPTDWKGYICWTVVVFVAVIIVGGLLGGWGQLTNRCVGAKC